jgi:hypothetical protein
VSDSRRYLRKHHAVVLVIPPVIENGTSHEPEVIDGHMLPLNWDLQSAGPPRSPRNNAHVLRTAQDPMSLGLDDIGEAQTGELSLSVLFLAAYSTC